MKSKYILASCVLAAGMLVSCDGSQEAIAEETVYENPMVKLYNGNYYNACDIWYDKETMVMYVGRHNGNGGTALIVMVNADGTPKLYKEEN